MSTNRTFHPPPDAEPFVLFGARTGNCMRAAIAMEAAGIGYRAQRIDLAAGEQRGARHLAIAPHGKVPVLTDGRSPPQFVLPQSNAIVLFAAEWAPAALLPGDRAARARTYAMYFRIVTDIIAPSHAGFRLGGAEGRAVLDGLAADAARQLEDVLERTPYLAGEQFTIADIAGYTILRVLLPSLGMHDLPRMAAWMQRTGELPAVRRGLAAFD